METYSGPYNVFISVNNKVHYCVGKAKKNRHLNDISIGRRVLQSFGYGKQ